MDGWVGGLHKTVNFCRVGGWMDGLVDGWMYKTVNCW